MIGPLNKTISNTFKTQLLTSEEENSSKLSQRIQQVSEEWELSYQDHLFEETTLSNTQNSSRFLAVSELNKYLFKNSEKKKQIEDLRSEINIFKGLASRISIEKKLDLESELENTLKKVELQENEQNSIKILLGREKEAILNIREQLIRLTDDHRKITKSYSEAHFSREKADYNLILINNEIVKAKKDEWLNNQRFKQSIHQKKKQKESFENEKKNIIENICKKMIENEENQSKLQKDKQEMEKTITSIENFQNNRKNDRKHLDDYCEQITKINEIIEKFDMETSEPPRFFNKETAKFLEKSVSLIISAYQHLKYKGESLSMQFSNLTKESSTKSQELEKYLKKFQVLKSENENLLFKPTQSKSTFNLTKEKIENLSLSTSQKEACRKIEEVVLKCFFELLTILEKSYKKFEEIPIHSLEDPLKDLKVDSIQSETLKELLNFHKFIKNQGALLETFKCEIFGEAEKKVEDRKSIRRDAWDIRTMISRWSKTYIPITQIKNKLGLLKDHDFDGFYLYCKRQHMLRLFIGFEDLCKFFKTFPNKRDLFLNIDSLYSSSHSRCRGFFARLTSMLTDFVNNSIQITALLKKGQFKFFTSHSNPAENHLKDLKIAKRISMKYPTQRGAQKVRVDDPDSDGEVKYLQPAKIKERNEKKTFHGNAELESPQKVLKEVLRIERQIKGLKSKERIAGIRDCVGKFEGQVNLNQPWAVRTPRAKSSQDRFISTSSLRMVFSPKGQLQPKV
jgi:hypothetical protein